jgi:hypothetical protein
MSYPTRERRSCGTSSLSKTTSHVDFASASLVHSSRARQVSAVRLRGAVCSSLSCMRLSVCALRSMIALSLDRRGRASETLRCRRQPRSVELDGRLQAVHMRTLNARVLICLHSTDWQTFYFTARLDATLRRRTAPCPHLRLCTSASAVSTHPPSAQHPIVIMSTVSASSVPSRFSDKLRAVDRLSPANLKHNNEVVFFTSAPQHDMRRARCGPNDGTSVVRTRMRTVVCWTKRPVASMLTGAVHGARSSACPSRSRRSTVALAPTRVVPSSLCYHPVARSSRSWAVVAAVSSV